jgi:hypothetical protein
LSFKIILLYTITPKDCKIKWCLIKQTIKSVYYFCNCSEKKTFLSVKTFWIPPMSWARFFYFFLCFWRKKIFVIKNRSSMAEVLSHIVQPIFSMFIFHVYRLIFRSCYTNILRTMSSFILPFVTCAKSF